MSTNDLSFKGAYTMEIYVVRAGDTIYSIAEKYGVSYRRLIFDNGISNPLSLVEGQALLILEPKTVYTVQQGDTLYSIALKFNTDPLHLRRNNPYITPEYYLSAGENLVIEYENSITRSIRLSGFTYPYINKRLLEQVLPYITYLIIFGYGFTENGEIITVNDEDVIISALENRTAVLLSLSLIDITGEFASAKLTPLLTDISFQNKVIEGMLAEIRRKGAQGMDIDMEYIPAGLRDGFTAFVRNAAERLHAEGYILNTDLAPKISADQKGLLYEAHDYAALGEASDLLFLMTYEWGYAFGAPMAIAPLPNVKRVLEYAMTEIPSEKLYLGMANYAYDWTLPQIEGVTRAETIGSLTAVQRAARNNSVIRFDEKSQSPYVEYTDDSGREHIIWFEDVRSFKGKYDLINESGIAGAGWWNFMRPFPQGYLLMNNMFAIEKVL